MSVLPDSWIRKMALARRMIDPFVNSLKRDGTISYGVSSYGYATGRASIWGNRV